MALEVASSGKCSLNAGSDSHRRDSRLRPHSGYDRPSPAWKARAVSEGARLWFPPLLSFLWHHHRHRSCCKQMRWGMEMPGGTAGSSETPGCHPDAFRFAPCFCQEGKTKCFTFPPLREEVLLVIYLNIKCQNSVSVSNLLVQGTGVVSKGRNLAMLSISASAQGNSRGHSLLLFVHVKMFPQPSGLPR